MEDNTSSQTLWVVVQQERSKLVAKLLPRQQKNAGQASLTLKDFIKWFLSVRDRVPKEEQTKSAPQTPSAVNGARKPQLSHFVTRWIDVLQDCHPTRARIHDIAAPSPSF
eukprot:720237-Rhodomonas_salina.2